MQDKRAVACAGEPLALLCQVEERLGLSGLAAAIGQKEAAAGVLHTLVHGLSTQADE